jgi:hypothetical protein
MARVIPSILVSDLSGKGGSVVFSKWKGRLYVRSHVIPANPNTEPQQAQRSYMTQAVNWWHDIEAQLQDECDRLAVVNAYSGFNAFVSRNVKDMHETVDPRIMPLNADINPIADTLAGAPGASGVIALTWTVGEAVGANKVYVLHGTAAPGADPANLTLFQKDTTAASAGALNVTGLGAGVQKAIYLLVEEVATHKFSVARCCHATSGA